MNRDSNQRSGGYYSSHYSGLGYFSPTPPPPKHDRRKIVAACAAGVVMVVAAVVVPITVGVSGGSAPVAAPSSTASSSRSLPPPSPNWTELPKQNKTAAVVPGWQGVKDPVEQTAYDVPPDWTVEQTSVGNGYASPKGDERVLVHAASTSKPGFCKQKPDDSRAFVGWPLVPRSANTDTAVRNLAHNMAKVSGADEKTMPQVGVPEVTDTEVYGGRHARMAKASAVPLDQSGCAPPKRTAVAVAFHGRIGTVVFMIVYDDGVAESIQPRTVDKIISSLRDLP